MTARIFAVLAAVFLVVAVAIAALTPFGTMLWQVMDKPAIEWVRDHSLPWMWNWIEQPFLVRPMWLIPVCLGVICAGVAASLNLGKASPSRRRRS